jgi:hypothetical protein
MRNRLVAAAVAGVAAAAVLSLAAPGAMASGPFAATQAAHRWHNISPASSAGHLNDRLTAVSCYAPNGCLAVGIQQHQSIARLLTGTRWSTKFSDLPDLVNQISCASARSCMATGFTGHLLATSDHWNGTSWTVEKTVNPAGSSVVELDGVSCPAAGFCVAIGEYLGSLRPLTPFAEFWNGKRWRMQAVPGPPGKTFVNFASISCPSGHYCVAVGAYHRGVFADVWNGAGWKAQLISRPAPVTKSLASVSCPSAHACLAVGAGYAAAWNGSKWQATRVQPVVPKGSNASLNSVSCAFATDCEAVGHAGDKAGVIAEQWNGKKWFVQHGPAAPAGFYNANLSGVSCVSPVNCVAVGYSSPTSSTPFPRLLAFRYW